MKPRLQLSERQRAAFRPALEAARYVLRRRLRVLRLVQQAYAKFAHNQPLLAKVSDDLRLLLRLARAWARRDYRLVPWRTIVFVVAALLYFVSPVDLIPDTLAGIGLVDDVAVIGAVVKALQDDLERFQFWERAQALPPGDAPLLPAATATDTVS